MPKGEARRKLPDKDTLRRLYWFDELSMEQIAERYDTTGSAVSRRLRTDGIKVRPARRRSVAVCLTCGKDVCLVKCWVRGKTLWRWSRYCVEHRLERRRSVARDWKRRTAGVSESDYRGPYQVSRTQSAIFRNQESEQAYFGKTRGVWKLKKSGRYGPMVLQLEQGKVK